MTTQMMEMNRYREARRQVGKRSARIEFLYLLPTYLLVSLGIILLDIFVVREATFFYLPLTFMSIGVLSRLVFGVLMFDRRGGLVCLNSAARFDKWNRAAVR